MNTVTILINPAKYPYHNEISAQIQETLSPYSYQISTLDVNSERYPHRCLNKLHEMEPDILITLDLAGFHFRTQAGGNALNMMYTKNLNLVWGDKPEYAPYLEKKVSLSMLFYDATGKDCGLTQRYPNVLYYKSLGELSPGMSAFGEVFLKIWEDFRRETLLSEV